MMQTGMEIKSISKGYINTDGRVNDGHVNERLKHSLLINCTKYVHTCRQRSKIQYRISWPYSCLAIKSAAFLT